VLRLGYSTHTSLPSTHTNTQQLFWTLSEVARLGAQVSLVAPRPDEGLAAAHWRDRISGYYGADPGTLPASLSIASSGESSRHWLDEVRFDFGAPARFPPGSHDLVWTRDYVAAAALVRAGRPTVFETYRLDLAHRRRFLPWRFVVLRSPSLRGVIAHSRLAGRAFVEAGFDEARCLVAHNGFAPQLMEPRLNSVTARRRLALPAAGPIVVYAGHVGTGKGMGTVVGLAARVPEARFVIVGAEEGSADGVRVAQLAAESGVRNLELRPRVPVAEVAAYCYAADCLLVPPTAVPLRRLRRTVLPMKIFLYLAAGRAILAPRLPDVEEVLTDGVTARLVPPDDVAGAADALRALLTNAVFRNRIAAAALAESARYTWEARARRILPFLEAQAASSPGS
jgi:glycosyltransferase involved in cell wall biosynthesis